MHSTIKTCLQALVLVSALFGATNLSAETAPAGQNAVAGPPAGDGKPGTGCTTIAKPAYPGGASIVQPDGESIQRKNWQPIGGELQLTVKSFEQIPPDVSVAVCFRWKLPRTNSASAGNEKSGYVEATVSKMDLDSDRKLLKVTTTIPTTLGSPPGNAETAVIPFVPLAEVRILAINNKATDPAKAAAVDATTTIGITQVWAALGFALLTVILGGWILYMLARKRLKDVSGINEASWPLQIIATPSGYASLSQLQIVLWTLVVAASTVYVMSLSGQLIQITNGTLVLLGIAGATGLAAKAHSEAQGAGATADAAKAAADNTAAQALAAEKEAAAKAAVTATPSDPAAIARAQAESKAATETAATKAKLAQTTKVKAEQLTKPPTSQVPRWSDLIVNETTADDGNKVREIDVTRFQMLMFTLITAIFVLMNVLSTYVIPEISTGFLTLMGISNGVYVGSKVVQRS